MYLSKAKVDTGAQANIMHHQVYTKLFTKSRLHPSMAFLQGYGGTQLHNLGIASVLDINRSNSTLITVTFYVTKEESTIILGLESSQEFGLINIAKDVKTVDGIDSTQLVPGNIDIQLRCKPYSTKAFKATLPTETAICSGKSKLSHENMEPVQLQEQTMRESPDHQTGGNINQLKLSLTSLKMGIAMPNWRKKWQKHLPLGKSGDAKAELMDIFLDLFKGTGMLLEEYSIEFKK